MPELTIATPALLFPALSLLLLAYTNRFLALAALIRSLYDRWLEHKDHKLLSQIGNLRHRVLLIRNMQSWGVFSILMCVVAMFCLYEGWARAGSIAFAGALIALLASLVLSLREIQLSVVALGVQLADIEEHLNK